MERKRHCNRWLILCVVAVLFSAQAAGASPLSDWLRPRVEKELRNTLHPSAKVGQVTWKFPRTLRLENVELPDLTIQAIELVFSVRQLPWNLQDPMRAAQAIKLVRPVAHLSVTSTGEIAKPKWLREPTPHEAKLPPPSVLLSVQDGDISIRLPVLTRELSSIPEKVIMLRSVQGVANLKNFPALNFSASARLSGKSIPGIPLAARGTADATRGRLQVHLDVKGLPARALEPWVPQEIPVADLGGLISGSIAVNVENHSRPQFSGEARWTTGQARLGDNFFSGVHIDTSFQQNRIHIRRARVLWQDEEIATSGKVSLHDIVAASLHLSVSGKILKTPLSTDLEIKGSSDEVNIQVQRGQAAGGSFHGDLHISHPLKTAETRATLYVEGLALENLAQGIPGMTGSVDQTIKLTGAWERLKLEGALASRDAEIFGQPVRHGEIKAEITPQGAAIGKLLMASPGMTFEASGHIDPNLKFSFQAQSQGGIFKGNTVLGQAHITLRHFSGRLSGNLQSDFFEHPLKHLEAEGKIELSQSRIGNQGIETGSGDISWKSGKAIIEKMSLRWGETGLSASGTTGIAETSNLRITIPQGRLEDLPILRQLLPEAVGPLSGTFTAMLMIQGDITEESLTQPFSLYRKLRAEGDFEMDQGTLFFQSTQKFRLHFGWDGEELNVRHLRWKTDATELVAAGRLSAEQDSLFSANLRTTLSTLRPVLGIRDPIDGRLALALEIRGNATNPEVSGNLTVQNAIWRGILLHRLATQFQFKEGKLFFVQPMEVHVDQNQLKLHGSLRFDGQPIPQKLSSVDLSLHVLAGDLQSVAHILANLPQHLDIPPTQTEWKGTSSLRLPIVYQIPLEQFLSQGEITLYSGNSQKILTATHEFEKRFKSSLPPPTSPARISLPLQGSIQGEIAIRGAIDSPTIRWNAQVHAGKWQDFPFDLLIAEGKAQGLKIEIAQLKLERQGGELSVWGDLDYPAHLDLAATAREFPADILGLLFPKGPRQIEGTFSGEAALSGSLEEPVVSGQFQAQKVKIAGTPFDQIRGSLIPREHAVELSDVHIVQGQAESKLHLTFPYRSEQPLSLSASLEGSSIALMNLLTRDVKGLTGQTHGQITIHGTRDHPLLNGALQIHEGNLSLASIEATLGKIQTDVVIHNSILTIRSFTSEWRGSHTLDKVNHVSLSGILDMRRTFQEPGQIDFHITVLPGTFWLSYPNLFTGQIDLRQLSLSGPMTLERNGEVMRSQGPDLQAEVAFSEGSAFLPKAPRPDTIGVIPALDPRLHLTLHFDKNFFMVAGDVTNLISTDLTNLYLNVEVAGENLKVSGRWTEPVLAGQVVVQRGEVHILNREFRIVPPAEQEKFYVEQSDKVQENLVTWQGGVGSEGVIPRLQITSKLETTAPTDEQEPLVILSRIQGMPFVSERERGIQIHFDSFRKVAEEGSNPYLPATYSDAELKVLLLPDYLKSTLGVSRGSARDVNVNQVLSEYLNSRFQALFLRGVERALEERLGLQSLSLEYNIGKDLSQLLGGRSTSPGEETFRQRFFGVGFAKGFFGRLFIDVRYRQRIEEATESVSQNSLNYQLTYKLSPTFSLIYYREPISLTSGIEETYYKITLKGTQQF